MSPSQMMTVNHDWSSILYYSYTCHAFLLPTVVRIGFDPAIYSVAESSEEVFINISVLEGQLDSAVDVIFTTGDGTASGGLSLIFYRETH